MLAYKKLGREKIKARIVDVSSKAEILVISIKSNFKHGKRLDIKYAISKLYRHLRIENKMPPRKAIETISKQLGISSRLVEAYTKQARDREREVIEEKIRELRGKGLNRYQIARKIEEEYNFPISPSLVKRVIKKVVKCEKPSQMTPKVKHKEVKEIKKGEKYTSERRAETFDAELFDRITKAYGMLKLSVIHIFGLEKSARMERGDLDGEINVLKELYEQASRIGLENAVKILRDRDNGATRPK